MINKMKYEITEFINDPDIKHTNGRGQVALLLEPEMLHPEDYVEALVKEFDIVFSHHKRYVELYDNWKYYPVGGTRILEEDRKLWEKKGGASMFISEKKALPGHMLRHKVYAEFKDRIDIFGHGFNFVENKADGLRNYPFSVVIENCRERGYFTEQIMDCFLTGTIPIYWGDPDIGDHFNKESFITWDGSMEDLKRVLIGCDEYMQSAHSIWENGIAENFEKAKEYIDYKEQIKQRYPELFK